MAKSVRVHHTKRSKRSTSNDDGGISRLIVRRPSAHGGYGWTRDLPDARDVTFAAIPSDHQNAAMNLGYVVQWWAFAALTLVGFGWVARREAHGSDRFDLAELYTDHPDAPVSPAI